MGSMSTEVQVSAEARLWAPLSWFTGHCEMPDKCWEPNSDRLQVPCVLLTAEPSLEIYEQVSSLLSVILESTWNID